MFLLRFCYVSRVKATILAPPHPSRDSPSSPSALGLSPRLRLRPPSGRPWPWPSWLARRSAAGVTATILAPQNPSRDSPSSPLALGMSPRLRLRPPSGRPWPWPSWLARRSAAGVTATILAPQNPSRDSPSSPLALGMSPQLRLRSPSRPQSQSLGLTCCSWRCERQPTAGLSMRLA